MKKEEYLSLIDEVIAQGPYTDTWDSLPFQLILHG